MNSFFDYISAYTDLSQTSFLIILPILCILSYLLGSLNFSVILSRKLAKDDVRSHGSGNAGTTNMLRTYGKKLAILTILGDMLKVAVAIVVSFLIIFKGNCGAMLFGENMMNDYIIALKSVFGLFCVLGHIFPCFFQFKGGKGVATCGGMTFMIDWRVALIMLVVFFIALLITKMVSVGSISMAVFYAPVIFAFHRNALCLIFAIIFALIVIVAHRENIVKIKNGTENKITDKKKTKE